MHCATQGDEDSRTAYLTQIVPDAAFIARPPCVFAKYTDVFVFELSKELSAPTSASIFTGRTILSEVPLMIVKLAKSASTDLPTPLPD